MRRETILFYDVDTQRDFMLPEGSLYVPGAEKIISQLQALTEFAREKGITIAGSVDRHFPGDGELQRNGGEYPDHCIDGTEGQKKIDATMPRSPVWVENREYGETEWRELLQRRGELYIEKQKFDVFVGNRNASRIFAELLRGKEDIIVYGVVTEVCVHHAITGLQAYPVRIHVPTDAIASLNEEKGREIMERWRSWEVHLTTVADIVARLTQPA